MTTAGTGGAWTSGNRIVRLLVITLCLSMIVAMWFLIVVDLKDDRQAAIENSLRENDNIAMILALQVQQAIRGAEVVIDNVESEYLRLGRPFDLREYAQNRKLFLDPSNVIAVMDGTGERIMTSLDTNKPANYRKGETFQHFVNTGSRELYISTPRLGQVSGKWTLYLSKPIIGENGAFGGIINYGLDPNHFAQIFNQTRLANPTNISLVGRDGIVRARNAEGDLVAGQALAGTPSFQRILDGGSSGNSIMDGFYAPTPHAVSFHKLPHYPLVAVVESPLTPMMANYHDHMYAFLLSGLAASLTVAGFATAILMALRRVTEREQQITALNSSLETRIVERTHDLAEAQRLAGLGSWTWDANDDDANWSEQQFRIFGYEPGEVEPNFKVFLDAVHPDDQDRVQQAINDTLTHGRPYDLIMRIVRPNGEVRIITAQGEVERDVNGKPLRIRGTNQDITERRKMEEALHHAQKMDSLGILAGGIAHSLNNLLVPVLTLSEVIRDDLPNESTARKASDKIIEASQHARDLVARVLAFSRRGGSEMETMAVGELVRNSLELARSGKLSSIMLLERIPDNVGTVRVDAPELEAIILNLVANAVDAIEDRDSGRVEVTTQRVVIEAGDFTAPGELGPGAYAQITVSDNGAGMDRETISKIFDPFFTTKEVGKGTGMGLALAHSTISRHGGAVRVESEPGTGTAFFIYLPLVENAAAPVIETALAGD